MSVSLVVARGLGRTYGEAAGRTVALQGLDLTIEAGERIAITGPSGAGKSTLLNLLGALDSGYVGSLRLSGAELRTLNDKQLSALRNRTIGFVFQSFNLLPNLTVGANLTLPAAFADVPTRELEARARELLARVGLEAGVWIKRPLALSGGQRQRVAIARALLLAPPLLLCDEPTGSLDRAHADAVLDLFDEIVATRGCALAIVTHDPVVVARMPRVLNLVAGRLDSDARTDHTAEGA